MNKVEVEDPSGRSASSHVLVPSPTVVPTPSRCVPCQKGKRANRIKGATAGLMGHNVLYRDEDGQGTIPRRARQVYLPPLGCHTTPLQRRVSQLLPQSRHGTHAWENLIHIIG